MATPLPVSFRASPLPSDFRGTPQQFMDALVARLSLLTQEELTLFVTGSVEPTSNQGPWLKDGTTWMVWSDDAGAYVPQTIPFEADLDPKSFRGNLTAPQDIILGGPGSGEVDLVFTEEFDFGDVFGDNIFVAPVDGVYHFTAKTAVSATAGTPTDNIVLFYLKKNGFQMPREIEFTELGNAAAGRTYGIETDLLLAAGDQISVAVGASIGGGTATWTVSQNDSWFSGFKVQST